jgi:hypothetical protein
MQDMKRLESAAVSVSRSTAWPGTIRDIQYVAHSCGVVGGNLQFDVTPEGLEIAISRFSNRNAVILLTSPV